MNHPNVLIIHHQGGGGMIHFLDQWKQNHHGQIYELYSDMKGLFFLIPDRDPRRITYPQLAGLIQQYEINELHIHHLWNIQISKLLNVIKRSGVSHRIWLHDFFSVCPFVFFVDQKGNYCGMPKEDPICDACASFGAKRIQMKHMLCESAPTIRSWRDQFRQLLSTAESITAPSESTKLIMESYEPSLCIDVIPHTLQLEYEPQKKVAIASLPIRIAVLGHIYAHKGVRELASLIMQSENAKLSCEFYLYGEAGRDLTKLTQSNFIKRSAYSSPDRLFSLLHEDHIDLVLIPSICPETFSYTTHEALLLGYPVICFDLGAQAEVVKERNAGWTVPANDPHGLYDMINELINNPEQIEQVKRTLYQGRSNE
ncbi:glycosyltransferase [Alkalicoccobacillus murimartini]|uniref:Glycosyltransferase involved in cell wall biosynthesis n=1 Tax=Alkalicoccobacillus murimartini TaxID=171685 RepID=A0ABT9YJ43_9BACI|nr:glycosyltransferase [Alkalicoccobacillus murimartini]MDQ0207874.1 glycosyltransferase involved in cell wall biosynthesis [Alkalicoccobacillus murimartini]